MADKNIFIRAYKKEKANGVKLVDLSVGALAGYYLSEYPNSADLALGYDLNDDKISVAVASSAKILIDAYYESLNKEN